jgi:uncharacterized protein (DUF488 family)
MQIYTVGYAKKSAEEFFELIKQNEIDVLVDVRLYNSSQLAEYAKKADLQYFLGEICDCKYVHTPQFAPTVKLLDDYKNGRTSWAEYEVIYDALVTDISYFEIFENVRICLLCAEEKPSQCHRRLLAEKIAQNYENVRITHL